MCFSATASFGASMMLAGIGSVSIIKAKTPSLRVLAFIPFIFSIQQFTEGWVWLSLTKENFISWKLPCTYIFLFFAEVMWPIGISFSMMLFEKKEKRKNILRVIFYGSIGLSAVLAYSLFYYTADVKVIGNHVMYSVNTPDNFKSITNVFYFITAVLPPFLSSVKKAWLIGIALIVSYLITKIFFEDYIISIWCYFATIISAIILWIILENKNNHHIYSNVHI